MTLKRSALIGKLYTKNLPIKKHFCQDVMRRIALTGLPNSFKVMEDQPNEDLPTTGLLLSASNTPLTGLLHSAYRWNTAKINNCWCFSFHFWYEISPKAELLLSVWIVCLNVLTSLVKCIFWYVHIPRNTHIHKQWSNQLKQNQSIALHINATPWRHTPETYGCERACLHMHSSNAAQ